MDGFIDRYGLELEAGYRELLDPETDLNHYPENEGTYPEKWKIVRDGSLNGRDGSHNRDPGPSIKLKEFVSPPIPYNSRELCSRFKTDINSLYKTIDLLNDSMGLHIHLSPAKDELWHIIQSYEFTKYFEEKIKNRADEFKDPTNSRILKRIKNNRYTKPVKDYQEVDKMLKNGLRYRLVNLSSKRGHGTVEIRVFPRMKRPSGVFLAVKQVTEIFNSFIKKKLKEGYKKEITTAVTRDKEPFEDKFTCKTKKTEEIKL